MIAHVVAAVGAFTTADAATSANSVVKDAIDITFAGVAAAVVIEVRIADSDEEYTAATKEVLHDRPDSLKEPGHLE